jgi:formylglycine-generating enzyme required for sulfatase activity
MPQAPANPNMIWIPGDIFRMGSDKHYPEKPPVHRVAVDGFWIDGAPVTNREFRKFVNATGYVTFAEILPKPTDYPGALPRDEFTPGGKHMANTWQGEFPRQNLCADGFECTSPGKAFPANGDGLHDIIGNVWEWTADWYSAKHDADARKACCISVNPCGGSEAASYGSCHPNIRIPRKVLRGGAHLCAPNYCRRYRPAARHAEPVDTSTSHVGFRCISRKRMTS